MTVPTIEALRHETQRPVIIVNHLGIVDHVNPMFEKVFGWEKTKIVGALLTAIIPLGLRDAHTLGFSKYMITAKANILNRPLRLKIKTGAGAEIDAEHFIVAERTDARWLFGATVIPVDPD